MSTLMEPIRDREVQISREGEAQDQDQEVQAHMIHLYSFSLVLKCSRQFNLQLFLKVE